jgi:predicted nuclease of restriction endonuclease-like (RecB) superfamily
MVKKLKNEKFKKRPVSSHHKTALPLETQFAKVSEMILSSRKKVFRAVDAALVDLYWNIGGYISERVARAEWGEGTVESLADYLSIRLQGIKGFSAKNLWRMRQFYDLYADYKKLSTLLREIPWSSHLHIMSKTRSAQGREFYLHLATKERLSVRELERAIQNGLFERSIAKPKVSAVLTQLHPEISHVFRDSYSLDFLGLPDSHSETDLRKGIVRSLKNFIIEFGRDFAFIGEEYRVQVGMKDFFLDLLFYHRELRCLVAFELKIDEFKPEYLGKLSFYLEALDRDVKKPHENPSIGVILCKGKDDEVVEYALSRTLSPAAIADYTTKLPDKRLLQNKLHEFFDLSVREMGAEYGKEGNRS